MSDLLASFSKPSITDEAKRDDLIALTSYWIINDPDPDKIRERLLKIWNHGLNAGKRQKQKQIKKLIDKMEI